MSDICREFIENNRDALETYRGRMSDECRGVSGFGAVTPKGSFDIILNGEDTYYLALCLLHIFRDFDNIEDRSFVLEALKQLYVFDEEGNIPEPELAYIYAYCLCQTDVVEQSFEVVTKLAEQCYEPALATMGDGCIAHKDFQNAIDFYSHAKDHGYMPVTFRIQKLALKNKSLLKQISMRIRFILTPIFRARNIIKKGIVGRHLLYLDFYGIKHHLKEYWSIPRIERIRMLNSVDS